MILVADEQHVPEIVAKVRPTDHFEYKATKEDATKEHPDAATSVASLIEQCRQMAIAVHIRLLISNIGNKSFIEKVRSYNVLTTTSYYPSPLQLLLKRLLDIVGGIIGSILALIIIAVIGPKIKKARGRYCLSKHESAGTGKSSSAIKFVPCIWTRKSARKN